MFKVSPLACAKHAVQQPGVSGATCWACFFFLLLLLFFFFFKLRVVKLQLLIEIDKLPDMQGTFAERKNMLVKKGVWYLHTTASGAQFSAIFCLHFCFCLFVFLVGKITVWN